MPKLSEVTGQKAAPLKLSQVTSTPQKGSIPGALAKFGPLGRGVLAAERGASFKDLPYVMAKTVSGVLGSGPERLLARPMAGLVQKEPSKINLSGLFPKPSTEAGKQLGEDLEAVGNFVDLGSVGAVTGTRAIVPLKHSIKRAVDVAKTEIPSNLPIVKRQFLRSVADKEKVLSGLQNVARRSAKKETLAIKDAAKAEIEDLSSQFNRDRIRQEVDALTQQLNQEAREGALEAQRALPQYFSRRSREYGAALDNILAHAERQNGFVPASDVSEALGNTVRELGIDYAGVKSPIENEIEALAAKYAQQAADGSPVRFDELIGIKQRVERMVSAAKQAGNQPYGAGEHSLSSFRENMGGLLEQYLPGLRELNQSYAPFVKLKREAVRVFKPFSGEYKTGESFLKRATLPRMRGTSEEAMLARLEAETGVPFASRVRQTTGRIQTAKQSARDTERAIGEQILRAQRGAEQRAKSIGDAAQQRLIELEAKKKKVSRNVVERSLGMARKFSRYATGRIL